MFKKILMFAIMATCCGYVFASDCAPRGCGTAVWPAPGSDADVVITTDGNGTDNIKIVSKIGADLVVENNVNLGGDGDYWSGGANMLHGTNAPAGFNIYEGQAEFPLMHAEMLETDGAAVLAVSRPKNKRPTFDAGYAAIQIDDNAAMTDMAVDAVDAPAAANMQDQVKSWVVASGQTLREVLQEWCDKEGWDLVWTTPREYPIAASAVFKGRFMDVSSALVRNFARANPIPYAKFYKGNRVLVISANEN